MEGLLSQGEFRQAAENGLVAQADAAALKAGRMSMPRLPDLTRGGGFSLDLRVTLDNLSPGQVLFDSRNAEGAELP